MGNTSRYTPLGPASEGLTFRPDVSSMVRFIHGLKGQFETGIQPAMAAAHAKMAERVQEYAVDILNEKRSPTRPRHGEDLLEASILAEGNREVTGQGFQVGLEAWLDKRSPAHAYARRIETGDRPNPMSDTSNPKIGAIVGFFADPGFAPPSPELYGVHGRLIWYREAVPGEGRVGLVKPADRVTKAGGYRMHRRAGQRFLDGLNIGAIYDQTFADHGLTYVQESLNLA